MHIYQNISLENDLNGSLRVYLTKNSKDCNKSLLDGATEPITMNGISLHIKDVSYCSDDFPVIELSDFSFQGPPCNLPDDVTMYTVSGLH